MLLTVVNDDDDNDDNDNGYRYTTAVVALYNMIRNNIMSLVISLNYNILFRHVSFCVEKGRYKKKDMLRNMEKQYIILTT